MRSTLLACCIALFGCDGWQSSAYKALNGSNEVVKGLSSAAVPIMDGACSYTANVCRSEGRNNLSTCPEIKSCIEARQKVYNGIILVKMMLINAKYLVDAGSQEVALEAVKKVLDFVAELTTTVNHAIDLFSKPSPPPPPSKPEQTVFNALKGMNNGTLGFCL